MVKKNKFSRSIFFLLVLAIFLTSLVFAAAQTLRGTPAAAFFDCIIQERCQQIDEVWHQIVLTLQLEDDSGQANYLEQVWDPASNAWIDDDEAYAGEGEILSSEGDECYSIASSEVSDIRLRDGPSISERAINQILADAESPAAGSGEYFIRYGLEYGIDPVFALAFFKKESGYGKAGVARTTMGIGNIVYTTIALPDYSYHSTGSNSRDWSAYNTWENSIKGWYNYIVNSRHYFSSGKYTLEEIIPIYAPNNPAVYINDIKTIVTQLRQRYEEFCGVQSTTTSTLFYEVSGVSLPHGPERISTNFIVLHDGGAGSFSSMIGSWGRRTSEGNFVSSHYHIDCDGIVKSIIPEQFIAYHAGCNADDSNTCYLPGINSESISIDLQNCEGDSGEIKLTAEQYSSLNNILKRLVTEYASLERDDNHIIAHFEVGDHNDPGRSFDWSQIGLTDHRINGYCCRNPGVRGCNKYIRRASSGTWSCPSN